MSSRKKASSGSPRASARSEVVWRRTTTMNMRDLSRDDDFLSHLLVEKLGTGDVPLLVHKMDPSRRLPKTSADDLLAIVRRLVLSRSSISNSIRRAVDELLRLKPVRYYLQSYDQKQINAFATHASRYFELYSPSGSIEIAHTSRYSQYTGKSELCILATRPMAVGSVINELKGSMADLTEEEDRELKRTDRRNTDGGIRRDFSVIHSRQMKKNHLFLGPARFVNHDCDHNAELFRDGRYITFRVRKPINVGDEITAHYGDSYFGRRNRYCLCETCEKNGRGGYAPRDPDAESEESDSDSDSTISSVGSISDDEEQVGNVNERRTRRGVYFVVDEDEKDSDESDAESDADSIDGAPARMGLPTPAESSLTPELPDLTPESTPKKPAFQSVISTRAQKRAQEVKAQLVTPPPSNPSDVDSISAPPPRSRLRDASAGPSTATRKRTRSAVAAEEQQQQSAEPERRSLRPRQSLSAVSSRLPRSVSAGAKAREVAEEERPRKRGRPPKYPQPPARDDRSASSSRAPPSEPEEPPRKRGRPSNAAKAALEAAKKRAESKSKSVSVAPVKLEPIVPTDEHGKPLPLCSVCRNILPVISVDDTVVWGMEESPKGKGKGKEVKRDRECPRCMRHFAIYGLAWPMRVPPKNHGHGSAFIPTPREESTPVESGSLSRKLTHKTLSSLDRKLAEAAAKKHKRARSEERATKKPPMEEAPRVKVSTKAREALQSKPNVHTKTGRRKADRLKAMVDEQPRKRGRPRKIKVQESEDGEPIAPEKQPRETNGRFGKKIRTNGIHGRKKAAVVRAAKAQERKEAEEAWRQDAVEQLAELNRLYYAAREERARKRAEADVLEAATSEAAAREADTAPAAQPANDHLPESKTAAPPSGDSFGSGPKIVGGLLYRTPNPVSFASRRPRWITIIPGADQDELLDQDLCYSEEGDDDVEHASEPPAMTELSSASDEELPVTPENVHGDDLVTLAGEGDDMDDMDPDVEMLPAPDADGAGPSSIGYNLVTPNTVSRLGSLNWKPSPVNVAMQMRKWSLSMRKDSPDRDEAETADATEDQASDDTLPRDVLLLRRIPGPSTCLLERSTSSASKTAGRGDSADTAIDLTDEPSSSASTARTIRHTLQSLLNEPLPKLTSKEVLLKPGSVHWLRKTALFSADETQPPTHLVDAGWDNSSEMSED